MGFEGEKASDRHQAFMAALPEEDCRNRDEAFLEDALDAGLASDRKELRRVMESYAVHYARGYGRALVLEIVRDLGAIGDVAGLVRLRMLGYEFLTQEKIAELSGKTKRAVKAAEKVQKLAELAGRIQKRKNFSP